MNNELLLSFKNQTDTLIEQTNTKPQETLYFKLTKQRDTSLTSPPLNLTDDRK